MIVIFSIITDWHVELGIILVSVLLYSIIDRVGKTIVLLETVTFFGCFICVLMPIISYKYYNWENTLARMFKVYMRVPEDEYFKFALPAMAVFTLAITWPMKTKYPGGITAFYKDRFDRITEQLEKMPKIGMQIVITGFITFYITAVLPQSLRFFAALFYFSSFAGLLYVYFGPAIAYKPVILLVVALFTIGNALQSGMFTIVIYMSATLFSFFFIRRRISLIKKISLFLIAIFSMVMLQSVKNSFRKATWSGNYGGNRAVLFQELVSNKLNSEQFLSRKSLFGLYMRSNQGLYVSFVMNRIPSRQPFDNGSYLGKTVASAFVPRFLWPDKPEAGGFYNMQHYAGVKLRNWSSNIGPLGEAYGNFGVVGGIIYMFFLGFFLRLTYKWILRISEKVPLIILWVPVIFYQVTYSAESDSLQILNSIIKSSFFLWLLYKMLPSWFGGVKRES